MRKIIVFFLAFVLFVPAGAYSASQEEIERKIQDLWLREKGRGHDESPPP